nr:phospholipase-like protein [Tanacetum cinerariifolium]
PGHLHATATDSPTTTATTLAAVAIADTNIIATSSTPRQPYHLHLHKPQHHRHHRDTIYIIIDTIKPLPSSPSPFHPSKGALVRFTDLGAFGFLPPPRVRLLDCYTADKGAFRHCELHDGLILLLRHCKLHNALLRSQTLVLYKDSVTIGHLGELVPDKAAKGKASQPRDKGDKVSVTIRDLGIVFSGSRGKKVVPTFMRRLVNDLAAWDDFPWGEYYWEEFHNKVFNLIDKRKNNHIEFKKENHSKLPTYTIHGFAWALKASICQDSNPTTKLQPTDAEMVQNWYRKSYDCLNSKEKSVQMDEFNVVSDHDDEFDSYTG